MKPFESYLLIERWKTEKKVDFRQTVLEVLEKGGI